MTTTTSNLNTIPIVIIGVHRLEVLPLIPTLTDHTPYTVSAILDTTESPKPFQYSAHNLELLLRTLYPRPRAVVTGTAVGGLVEEVRGFWEGFVREVLEREEAEGEGGRWCYVPLTDFHSEDGPPPPGTQEYLMRRLDEVFRPAL